MQTQKPAAPRGPKPNPNTRDNLIRAGMRIIHEAGYTASGIKDIVDEAGLPKGSFYNHFESKEAFGEQVIDFYFEKGLPELRALLGDGNVPPLKRLQTYFEERMQGYEAAGYAGGCMLGNLSLEVADQSAAMRSRLAEHFETWSGLLETCIVQAQRTGAMKNQLPASLLARFLLNSWEGALVRMKAEKSNRPLKEFVQAVFGSILV